MSVINVPGIIRGGQTEKYADSDRYTCTVAAGKTATGGLLVESAAGDRVVETAATTGSLLVLGVAIHDAAAAAKVTVASDGVWMLTAEGTIGAGNKVVAATSTAGRVKVSGATPDARTLVGRVLSDVTDGLLVPTILTP